MTSGKNLPYLERNHIMPFHLITKQYTPGSGPWVGPIGQKLGHTNFKVIWKGFFKQSYLIKHWQEPSHTWNIIYIIALPFITKH